MKPILIHKYYKSSPKSVLLENDILSQGIQSFKFNIIETCDCIFDGCWNIGIGLIPSTKSNQITDKFFVDSDNDGDDDCYCYMSSVGKKQNGNAYGWDTPYGVKSRKGDIIEMIVDFDKLQLKYMVNDNDQGIAFNIQSKIYRVAVYFWCKGNKIKLIQ